MSLWLSFLLILKPAQTELLKAILFSPVSKDAWQDRKRRLLRTNNLHAGNRSVALLRTNGQCLAPKSSGRNVAWTCRNPRATIGNHTATKEKPSAKGTANRVPSRPLLGRVTGSKQACAAAEPRNTFQVFRNILTTCQPTRREMSQDNDFHGLCSQIPFVLSL